MDLIKLDNKSKTLKQKDFIKTINHFKNLMDLKDI